MWHASCLAPPLPFPLRPQDEIVCSEECWTELVQATLAAGGTTPQREDPNTSRKFLLHTPARTSTRPTLYPTISPNPHTQDIAHSTSPNTLGHASTSRAHRRSKRSRSPPPAAPPEFNAEADEPPARRQTGTEPSPQPTKRQRQGQQQHTPKIVAATTVAAAAPTAETTVEPAPQRWVALEPSPRPAKKQRRRQDQGTDDGARSNTEALSDTTGTDPTEPEPQRWVALEDSPRPTKRQRTAQTEPDPPSTAPTAVTSARKRKRQQEGSKQRSSKKKRPRLSNHINPWTINNSRLRIISERASARVTTVTPDTGHVHTAALETAPRSSSPPP